MVKDKKIIIAGPCAIESKKQFFSIAKEIHSNINFLRCGVWKARTNPYSFSGVGLKALDWVQEIQKKFNVKCAVEVGTTEHVQLALKHKIKTMWLGARTTCNPFIVEQISSCVKNKEVEIWIKNPIFADMKLWFGAIERFKNKGVSNIKVIHRGFFSENKEKYRNPPRWDLLVEFKKKYPEIPLICDPSHISGNKNLIREVTNQAVKYNVSGFMVEVHENPENALSDSMQQLDLIEFREFLSNLK